jgi:hypothetical protein
MFSCGCDVVETSFSIFLFLYLSMTSLIAVTFLMATLAKAQEGFDPNDPWLAPLPPIDESKLDVNGDGDVFKPSVVEQAADCSKSCIQDLPALSQGKVSADAVRNMDLLLLFGDGKEGDIICDGSTRDGFVKCLTDKKCTDKDSIEQMIQNHCNPPAPAPPTTPEEDEKIQKQVADSVNKMTDKELEDAAKKNTANGGTNNNNNRNDALSVRATWSVVFSALGWLYMV